MIDHTYRAIFIHNRKAAGISVLRAFGFERGNALWHAFNEGALDPKWPSRPAGYFVFSVVRNPFDRLVSGWRYFETTRDRPLASMLTDLTPGSKEHRHIVRSQAALLTDRNSGELVTDDLIRFEDLQSGFDRVCDRIGKPRVVLGLHNASVRSGDYRAYFDAETRRAAERLFAEDLERFGYTF